MTAEMDRETRDRFEAQEKALVLQAREYERRLELLNHEASKLAMMQSTYIPREVFDRTTGLLKEKIESIQKTMYIWMGGMSVIIFAISIYFSQKK